MIDEMTGEQAYAIVMRRLGLKVEQRAVVRRVKWEINEAALPKEDIPLSPLPLRWVPVPAKRDQLPTLDGELRRGIRLAVDAAKRLAISGQQADPLKRVGVGLRT